MTNKYQEIQLEAVGIQPATKCYKRGVCRIMISPPHGTLGWHMSISSGAREPTWGEIRDAWYDLIPDSDNKNGAMFFPPKDEYINIHNFCFHVHEVHKDLKTNLKI